MSLPRRSSLLAAGMLCFTLSSPGAADARDSHSDESNDCSEPEGTFWSAVAPGPDCKSPVGFCTQGELSGEIEGEYAFAMTSMTPVPGDEALGHFTFTGESTITTADGVMYSEDTGELWFSGDFAFMTTVGIYGGDGCYEGAEGSLVATGNLNLVTGLTEGTYTSRICHAQSCFRGRGDEHAHGGDGW